MGIIQLGGNLKLGPTGSLVDYSDNISQMVLNIARAAIAVPATLGLPTASQSPGSKTETLQITYHSDLAAASVWAELYDAIMSDAAELDFEGTFEEGAVSVDNPKFSGTIRVMGLATGGVVGSLRQQSQTWPLTEEGHVKATS